MNELLMKFIHYLAEIVDTNKEVQTIRANKLSQDVGMKVYIKGNHIYIKDDDSIAVHDFLNYMYTDVVQILKDYIIKNYMPTYNLKDRIPLLLNTPSNDPETDLYLLRASRTYQHKPIICSVSNIDDHNYIIGYHATDLNKAAEYIGLPKEGHTLYILDGKFVAAKAQIDSDVTAYVISPNYRIRKADGNTEITIADVTLDIKHIRRQL